MRQLVRLLLVLVLIPALTMAILNPTPAYADDPPAEPSQLKYGTWMSFQSNEGIHYNGFGIGHACDVHARWVATGTSQLAYYSVQIAAHCRTLAAMDAFNLKPDHRVTGTMDGTGRGCNLSTSASIEDFRFSWGTKYSSRGTIELGNTQTGVCTPASLSGKTGFDTYYDGPVNLGPRPTFGPTTPDLPTGDCTLGTPLRLEYVDHRVLVDGTERVKVELFGNSLSGGWQLVFVHADSPDVPKTVGAWTPADGISAVSHNPLTAAPWISGNELTIKFPPTGGPYSANWKGNLLGFQLVPANGAFESKNVRVRPGGWTPSPTEGPAFNGGWLEYVVGQTDPAYCTFWFGQKILTGDEDWTDSWSDAPGWEDDDPGEPEPEPAAPGWDEETAPPEAENSLAKPDEDCEFSITDPGSWLSGGMCALVGLLGAVVNGLNSVISAVLGLPWAILTMFVDQFIIPSNGFMADQFESLRDAWDESGPGEFFDGVTGGMEAFELPEAGSCEGPKWEFEVPSAQHDIGFEVEPLNSCDGFMSTFAVVVRAALMVTFGLWGVVSSARIIGNSFGLNLRAGGD